MNRLICLAIAAASLCIPATAIAADPPPAAATIAPDYLLLRAPQQTTQHHATHGYYPGRGYGVSTNAYAYGWFGAAPRRHWSRHFGYYNNFRQWSQR